MKVNDFFKGVSDAFAANRSNAALFFSVLVFFLLAVFVYFKYMRVKKPEEAAEPKKVPRQKHTGAAAFNCLIEGLFSGETASDVVALKNLTCHYIDKFIENSLDALVINALNTKYWELVLYIINRKYRNGGEGMNLLEIEFSEDEKKIIDFAYLSDRLILSGSGFDEKSLNDAMTSDEYLKDYDIKYHTITSWLADSLREFNSSYAIERLSQEYASLVSKISIAGQEKEISLKTRKLILYEIAKQNAGKPFVKALMATSEKIDRIIDAYSFYKYKTDSGYSMTKNELLEFVNIENFLINSLRNERREELKNIAYGERYNTELINLETEIINKECLLLNLVSLKARCVAEMNKHIGCQKQISAQSNIEFLTSKVEYLKNTLGIVAKRNEIEPILFMTKKINKKIPDLVFKIIAKFIEADPMVFKNKTVKNAGLPEILFVPGCGNGIYNVEMNALILPEFPIKDYYELVISALALYRWETDDDGNLKRSFHSLKCNKRLSFASLQQAFVKDYVLYVTKEKEGTGLDKEILDWFKFEIAPKKGEEIRVELKPRAASKEAAKDTAKEEAKEAVKETSPAAAERETVERQAETGPGAGAAAEAPPREPERKPNGNESKTPVTESSEPVSRESAAAGAVQPAGASSPQGPAAPVSEEHIKRELIFDKLKLLFKDGDLDENRITVNFIDENHNFNIEFKSVSVAEFDELLRMVFENPKLRDYISGLYRKKNK